MTNYELEARLEEFERGCHVGVSEDAHGGKKKITNSLRRVITAISRNYSIRPELVSLLNGVADKIDDDWKADCLYWRNKGKMETMDGINHVIEKQNHLLREAIRHILFDLDEPVSFETQVEICNYLHKKKIDMSRL